MFTIIGGDGKEYGPVSAEQLRSWIAGGRANLDTKARAVGSDEWRRLGDLPEFGSNVPPQISGASVEHGGYVPTPDASVPQLASLWKRLGGACINALFYVLVMVPGFAMALVQILKTNPDLLSRASGGGLAPEDINSEGVAAGIIFMGLGLLGFALLQIILLSVKGRDVGKLIIGTRIVRMDGSRAGFVHAVALRGFVPGLISMLPWIGNIFSIVNICFIFREDRRCLHDLIAGTKVVKA
jgi:uncharacterized RDD family membrane protein YckC